MKSTLVADFEKFALGPKLDLYVHPTKKFKTLTIQLYVHQPLGRDATRIALLPSILRRGCQGAPTQREIVVFLEELYGASLTADVLKMGERQILYFRIDVVNDRYAPKKIQALSKSLEFLKRLLTRPVLEKGSLRKDYVEQEKENLGRFIDGLINERGSYAMERCVEKMFAGEPYALYEYGRKEDLAGITPKDLTRLHEKILARAPIELFVVGDVKPAEVAGTAARLFKLRGRKPVDPPPAEARGPSNGIREIVEPLEIDQGKLVMGCRTGTTWADDDVFPLVVFNGLFGAYPHSKLFVNVRERDGLAYSTHSSLDHTKGALFITAGIDFAKYADCVRVVKQEMEDMRAGKFSDEDFEKTMNTLVDRARTREDSPSIKINGMAEMLLNKRPLTRDQIIERLRGVRREDVVRVAGKVRLDTIYFLTRPS